MEELEAKLSGKLDAKKKEQLLKRVQECCDKDTLTFADWMQMYDILLKSCERESASLAEELMIDSVNGGGPVC